MNSRPRGGDVSGTTRIEVTQGEALRVPSLSFDPGYSLEETFEGGDERNSFSKADLIRGYCTYGRLVGER
jgi:hypothetical protein